VTGSASGGIIVGINASTTTNIDPLGTTDDVSPGGSPGFIVTNEQTPVCYCRGTRIRNVAIEELSVGDLVVTASGEEIPIKGIGWRDIDCAAHPQPHSVWPVRIAAGALAAGLPERDLRVSVAHDLFIDGVLVPAGLLVNKTTIVQEPVSSVSYWHVELDRHDLLVAEEAPAESYLDCRNRQSFANGGPVMSLHADFSLTGEC